MLLYCLKVYIGEEEVKHWQNFVFYHMDSLLQTLSHIRIRLTLKRLGVGGQIEGQIFEKCIFYREGETLDFCDF